MTGDGLVLQLYAYNLLRRSHGLLLCQGIAPDEATLLVELDKETQASHDGRDVSRQLVAIERQTHLKAQGVAASQPAGLHAGLDEPLPVVVDSFGSVVNLEAVLARVACAADDEGAIGRTGVDRLCRVELHLPACDAQHLLDPLLGLGTLHGYLAVMVTHVLQVDVEALGLLLHPGPVLVDVGGVDNEEIVVLAHAVDQQVVDRSAVLVAHHAVENLSHRCATDVVGKDVLHIALSIFALDGDFAHVADVEDAAAGAHSLVLVGDVGVLYGHVESGEGRHQRAQCHVFVVQTGLFHRFEI